MKLTVIAAGIFTTLIGLVCAADLDTARIDELTGLKGKFNEKEGVWRCRTTFNCTDACPRGIQVTKAIQEVKRAILFERF